VFGLCYHRAGQTRLVTVTVCMAKRIAVKDPPGRRRVAWQPTAWQMFSRSLWFQAAATNTFQVIHGCGWGKSEGGRKTDDPEACEEHNFWDKHQVQHAYKPVPNTCLH